jgi:LysM repeat protein
MPRYSPQDIKRSNRTLLIVLILLVGIIVAFIVAIASSSNDSTLIVTQEVNNLKRMQEQQALEEPADTIEEVTEEIAQSPTITTQKPEPLKVEKEAFINTTPKPETKVETPKEEKVEVKPPSSLAGKASYSHVIGAGDNLSSLSRRYHVLIADLKSFNKLENEGLVAGKSLQIPITAIHKVANGENLGQIASKYGVKPELIKKANKLNSDNVALAAQLVIPLP